MKAQLNETVDDAVKVELLPGRLVAEDALRRGEDYLRLTIDAIPVLAWCNGPDGSNEFLNQRWLDYTGLAIEEARGWGWKAAIHPDDLPQLLNGWQELLVSGKSGELEARLRRADGVYRWFLFRVEPLRAPQGTIVKWYGTNTDIDDRKRAEALLTPLLTCILRDLRPLCEGSGSCAYLELVDARAAQKNAFGGNPLNAK
jgi:PAS domain S-box-containing protein